MKRRGSRSERSVPSVRGGWGVGSVGEGRTRRVGCVGGHGSERSAPSAWCACYNQKYSTYN